VAIKPLFLGQDEPNKIFEHGGFWVSKIARLQKHKQLPAHTLFAIDEPAAGSSGNTKRKKAAQEIVGELRDMGVQVVAIADRSSIITFAEQAKPIY